MMFSFPSRPASTVRFASGAGVLLLISLLAGAPTAFGQSARRLQAVELVKEAALDFSRGDFSLVVKICRQAIALDPTYPRAYTWLGAVYQRRGDRPNACGAYAQVVKLAPKSPDAARAARGLRELDCASLTRQRVPVGASKTGILAANAALVGARLQGRWVATAGIASLAWTPDGQQVSGGGSDGSWRLWRALDGRLERLERGSGYEIGAVAIAPGANIVGSGDGKIRFFDSTNGAQGAPIDALAGAVTGLSVSADGQFLAAAGPDNALKIFEAQSHRLRLQIPSEGASLAGVAWSPDGEFLAVGIGSAVRIYDRESGRAVRVLAGDGLPVSAVAWSRTGNWIAGAFGSKIRVWNATTGALQRVLSGHTLAVSALAFGADATLASGGYDRQLRLWNARSGANQGILRWHTAQIRALSFDKSGKRLASADQNGLVGVWSVP